MLQKRVTSGNLVETPNQAELEKSACYSLRKLQGIEELLAPKIKVKLTAKRIFK